MEIISIQAEKTEIFTMNWRLLVLINSKNNLTSREIEAGKAYGLSYWEKRGFPGKLVEVLVRKKSHEELEVDDD